MLLTKEQFLEAEVQVDVRAVLSPRTQPCLVLQLREKQVPAPCSSGGQGTPNVTSGLPLPILQVPNTLRNRPGTVKHIPFLDVGQLELFLFRTMCSGISKAQTVGSAEPSFPAVSRAVLTQTHYFLLVEVKQQFSQKGGR